MKNDSRYPYTYACDYLRMLAGCDEGGMRLSRSDASQVRQGIANALGMDDAELARKLADCYKENQDSMSKLGVGIEAKSSAIPSTRPTY